MKKQLTFAAATLLSIGLAAAQTDSTRSTVVTTPSTAVTPATSTTLSTTPATTTYETTTTTRERVRDYDNGTNKPGRLGIYAGLNASRFVNTVYPEDSYLMGWQLGAYYRTPGTIFGQIGAEYRTTSSNYTTLSSGTTPTQVTGKINQHFLVVPAYVGLRVGGGLGLRLQAGAELATLLSIGDNKIVSKDDLKRTIVNGLLDAGINLGPLTLDVVYNHGFTDAFEGAAGKRNMLMANVGFRF